MGRVRIRVAPGARRSELVARYGDGWRARVAKPPEGGRANLALAEVLAQALGVPAAAVSVVAGHAARAKIVEVEGLDDAEIERRLAALLD